jgi:MerR family transcriptional regulator, light-induced transcriptional regulator
MVHLYEELGEPSRRSILCVLRTGPKNVSELVCATSLKQPNVSNHLSRLRERGVVSARRVGREVYYALAGPEVEEAIEGAFKAMAEGTCFKAAAELAVPYAKAAASGDEAACMCMVDSLYRRQVPLLEVYTDVIAPAMDWIGCQYDAASIDEGQEHIASEITTRMMARTAQRYAPCKSGRRIAVVGCAEGNWHMLASRMLADLLNAAAWKTIFLGANVPNSAFFRTVQEQQPELVLISATVENSFPSLLSLVNDLATLRARAPQLRIGLGGPVAERHEKELIEAGADFYCPDIKSFAEAYLPSITEAGESTALAG